MPWGPAGAGDTNVDVAIRWGETGADIPAKTAAHLAGLKGAAAGAGTEIGERMTAAFGRLEAREPTMVLRRGGVAVGEEGGRARGGGGARGGFVWARSGFGPGGGARLGVGGWRRGRAVAGP